MPKPIRFIQHPVLHGAGHYEGDVDFAKLMIGDMCYHHHKGAPCVDGVRLAKMHLTAHYYAVNATRPPLILALPDKAYPDGKLYFLVDGQCYSNKCTKCGNSVHKNKCAEGCVPRGYYDGWTVTGDISLITVHPSVNYDDEDSGPHYHGFIANGIIGDG